MIVDVETSAAARPAELTAVRTMIERVQERHDLHPDRLAADTGYSSNETLEWLVNHHGIAPTSRPSTSLAGPAGPSPETTPPMIRRRPISLSGRQGPEAISASLPRR
ncbi:MAG: hypothetical protein B7Z12_12305 [Caulobacter vibrioides]|uniref:Transposase n=2 Tax=Caulobacter TaxID=75 RepID=A0A258D3V9_CAUVI|nr:MAG: hypothetical protein B7Z12_12305 [Caulobacter vibrioides]